MHERQQIKIKKRKNKSQKQMSRKKDLEKERNDVDEINEAEEKYVEKVMKVGNSTV